MNVDAINTIQVPDSPPREYISLSSEGRGKVPLPGGSNHGLHILREKDVTLLVVVSLVKGTALIVSGSLDLGPQSHYLHSQFPEKGFAEIENLERSRYFFQARVGPPWA